MNSSPSTLWLTGLSASGKSTLAKALEYALTDAGATCRILDGDAVRQELSRDLGFSREDRRENVRRVAQRCLQLNEAGAWAIAALISPWRDDRLRARAVIGESRFFEIHLATPLEVCEARDPKGLYRAARAGKIADFTGVDDAYEVPLAPDLRLDTSTQSVVACVEAVMSMLAAAANEGALTSM
jgi:adenylylsulfate kinase